ncbi:MAG: YdcH family protein [Pseudomonadota bacterium]
MSHTPHELADDFPEHPDRIHDLKVSDPHFARLFEEYHEINRAIHRAETLVEPVEELAEADMRKARMRLKDELYSMLSHADT